MNLIQILERCSIPAEIQRKVQCFLVDEKDKYNQVMKELSGRYNQGLWWLTVSNVRFSWQTVFDSIDNEPGIPGMNRLHYYLAPGKALFLDYSRPDEVVEQAITMEYVVRDIEGWSDTLDNDVVTHSQWLSVQPYDEPWYHNFQRISCI